MKNLGELLARKYGLLIMNAYRYLGILLVWWKDRWQGFLRVVDLFIFVICLVLFCFYMYKSISA